jgi:endonuclease G, mitochondrial
MKKFLVALFLVSSSAYAGISQQCSQFIAAAPTYAAKPGDQEICHKNYAVIHSCSAKAPVAVFEHLTPAVITGGFKRKDDFRPDPLVTPNCSASLADYATVGKTHDRGHMAPAGNNTISAEIMSESFFLSNMVPQVANNNRGIWKQAEMYERQWAMTPNTEFYIISGGIFDKGHPVTGNGLGIPTRLYKIVYEKKSKKVTAWLMPNAALPVADLPKYQTTVPAIEEATGIKFNLPLGK